MPLSLSLRRGAFAILALVGLAGCEVTTVSAPTSTSPSQSGVTLSPMGGAPQNFARVVRDMEPVMERECQRLTRNLNCDFLIQIDPRRSQPANAYQTLDKSGRPLLVFTRKLIQQARNSDELAFVMGHEGAHHIRGHIARQQSNAQLGALIFTGLAAATGSTQATAEEAARIGAFVGARRYSKDFELEADELGTILTAKGGYNPVRGSEFFTRIPDPGDKFLGTHPPNAERIATVRRTAAGL